MNMRKMMFAAFSAAVILTSCDTTAPLVSIPEENVDSIPLKVSPLTEDQEKAWGAKDIINDTIPGMSVDKTYTELINSKGTTVIVGVIDSGVDIDHEDLKDVIWTNEDEIPNNGKDDDKNGYIDDIHGWNFLGDVVAEQLEYARIVQQYKERYSGKTLAQVPKDEQEQYNLYQKAQTEYDKEYDDLIEQKTQYEQIVQAVEQAHKAVSEKLGKEDYTAEEVAALEATDEAMLRNKSILGQMLNYADSIPEFLKLIKADLDSMTNRLNANLSTDAHFRDVVGDDPDDIKDTDYGNNNVTGPDKEEALHGTHVAGIIAAERDNGIGMNGVANNVKIMSVRAVPDGDERDKDIALAIRYAVDNGAKVINTSFGKYFSTHPEWVNDAIEYAAKKDVLIVNAAGNEGLNLDEKRVYPNDQTPTEPKEISDTFLTVGSLTYTYGAEMVSSFSNYGKSNVDVFAPGSKIWSTTPLNEYEYLQGTSMAAPAAAGVAAMVRSYFPNLKASEVKQVLMESGLSTTQTVVVGGESSNTKPFTSLSTSGKMVNLYNALILASKK
ncbi:MAG TPA: peptidase S8 [Flavobacteriaceae bacterium]|nr:peptidase S8 [Flavobacteriaceae bacterium]